MSDFLTVEEEAYLLHNVRKDSPLLCLMKRRLRVVQILSRPPLSWKQLSRRRLQVYPFPLSTKNEMTAGPLPSWLEDTIISRLSKLPLSFTPSESGESRNLFSSSPHGRPNHCLVNEYPPGMGIFPHEDGPAYYPIVATVSMGGHTVLDIYAKNPQTGLKSDEPTWRVLQERRSLLVTMGSMHKETLHGIAEVEVDENLKQGKVANWDLLRSETRSSCEENGGKMERSLRISATFRDVLNVTRDWGRLVPSLGKKR